ncbi:MAG: response regulator transcription factor [Burkholderiales bacterium]|nr:response regulator transcription factor [Burkholderiales bacterium]
METSRETVDKVLWVEDDTALSAVVSDYLQQNGLEVTHVSRGDQAAEAALARNPSVILLDIMLPGLNGIEVCRRLRAAQVTAPIVMLTAKDEDFDKVLALELGADDYLVKPVQPRVLLAFLRAAIRRAGAAGPVARSPDIVLGGLVVSRTRRSVLLRGTQVRMSAGDFDLLWILAERAGHVVPREELLRELRGLEDVHDDRSVDARFYRLRRRFDEAERPEERLRSIRPHGYMMTSEPW